MITVTQLSMRYGAKILFKNTGLQFNSGSHYGLIGANGSVKSTFLTILSGEINPESGQVSISPQLFLGTLQQDHFLYENEIILEIVLRGRRKLWEALQNHKKLLELESFTETECETLTSLEKTIQDENGYSAESEAAKLLEGLGIRVEYHKQPLNVLSGGYKLRVLLAQVLFGRPDILLLDEPTNHLDLFSIKWLENYLRNFPGTLLVTSHDRDFLNGVSNCIVDFDYGTVKIYKGNYDTFVSLKQQDQELKELTFAKQDKRRKELQEFVDRFRAKATKARQAQSRARMVEKLEGEMDSVDFTPSSRGHPKLSFDPLRATGVIVLKTKGITKAYTEKKVLENVSFELERGERLAVIGPNGIGKSTLLEILTRNTEATEGQFEWGFAARPAYFPQDYARELSGSLSLLDWLSQFDRDLPQEKLREILARVLFSGETVKQSIHTLSGGESARLILAKLMLQKPNVLILDEPTNHLDMEAIDELTRALQVFDGTILLVSHNRYFVSQIATRILEITFQGIKDYKCSFAEYLRKQENDYLSAQNALSRRYDHEISNEKSSNPIENEHSYDSQKRLKSLKARLNKQMQTAEENCHQVEEKIKKIESLLSVDGFYQNSSTEEQKKTLSQKAMLDEQLIEAMDKWEKTMVALQEIED